MADATYSPQPAVGRGCMHRRHQLAYLHVHTGRPKAGGSIGRTQEHTRTISSFINAQHGRISLKQLSHPPTKINTPGTIKFDHVCAQTIAFLAPVARVDTWSGTTNAYVPHWENKKTSNEHQSTGAALCLQLLCSWLPLHLRSSACWLYLKWCHMNVATRLVAMLNVSRSCGHTPATTTTTAGLRGTRTTTRMWMTFLFLFESFLAWFGKCWHATGDSAGGCWTKVAARA